ncbi:hypothetical protein [Acinetobacter faecalis]|uniref:Uncharacterized protein n=4 Tax=Acinetobacter faecalis TaxID=2665161 RepID=A0AB35UVR3_9GAMM|nr:hypothetical protein [Acinetobacter faecalis]MDY6484932.1 hypothetical protein [Acinetobacter faecalis]MDY6486460.1 hypothetical protein [Acinetobacter faecalis]
MSLILHTCRICGFYDEEYYPWGEDGESPTYDICDYCGVEFGYEDCNLNSIRSYRKTWMHSVKYLSEPRFKTWLINIDDKYK